MAVRRSHAPSTAPGVAVLSLEANTPWRELVHPDADLDHLAERLYRAARTTCAASTLAAGTIRPPSGPTTASIDTIDAWLAQADAADGGRRREWCWKALLSPHARTS